MNNLFYLGIVYIILAFIIAIIDYIWYGRKIKEWNKKEIIGWYFGRTIGELIAFTLGFILAWSTLGATP